MLKFIGSGSAFNVDLGNNSAYIEYDSDLLLIDCGSSIFERILHLKLLDDLKKITILITHPHSDHIGSLGDLIFYCYYRLGIKPCVLYPDIEIKNILLYMGVWDNIYSFDHPNNFKDIEIVTHETVHIPDRPNFKAYSYLIKNDENKIFYSGDSNKLDDIIVDKLKSGELTAIYQDVTCKDTIESKDSSNYVHLRISQLEQLIPKMLRNKVWCMHLEENFDKNRAFDLGFNVVENDFLDSKEREMKKNSGGELEVDFNKLSEELRHLLDNIHVHDSNIMNEIIESYKSSNTEITQYMNTREILKKIKNHMDSLDLLNERLKR